MNIIFLINWQFVCFFSSFFEEALYLSLKYWNPKIMNVLRTIKTTPIWLYESVVISNRKYCIINIKNKSAVLIIPI